MKITLWRELSLKDKIRRDIYMIIIFIPFLYYGYRSDNNTTLLLAFIGLLGSIGQTVYYLFRMRTGVRK